MSKPAILALADGSIFRGFSVGADGSATGEVVFNTAMTGYQEILTDPSYAKQLVALTYPHIGSVGCNPGDVESEEIWVEGLIIRHQVKMPSNWRSTVSLSEYLKGQSKVAIEGIDTRKLTRVLREKGAQAGCLVAGESVDEQAAIAEARKFAGLQGMDLAKEVTTDQQYEWTEAAWSIEGGFARAQEQSFHVVAYDFGVKKNILRLLVDRGCQVTVVPAQTPAADVLAMNPDGIFLSNGPGDPEPCQYAVEAIQTFLSHKIPMFGICLGHQLLGLASGCQTMKMKFGHHGANHPVKDLVTGKVMITSQNHGFALDDTQLPEHVKVTHRSLFDQSLQGISLKNAPAFGFQGHPEASPGPHDVAHLFDQFVALIDQHSNQKA